MTWVGWGKALGRIDLGVVGGRRLAVEGRHLAEIEMGVGPPACARACGTVKRQFRGEEKGRFPEIEFESAPPTGLCLMQAGGLSESAHAPAAAGGGPAAMRAGLIGWTRVRGMG